jgi:beta-alanine--pyruvate transaminase
MSNRLKVVPNDLSAFWMPFTANRQFKQAPRMFVSAKDMHYTTTDGRKVLDGTSGLWCVNAGHCRPKITEAIQQQAGELDYAPAFQMGHPLVFEFANRLVDIAPKGLDHVFFTNSGSESVDTALKIALAYHRAKGEGSRFRLIGRERGYHGVNFGGISVGGIGPNRKMFGTLLTGVDHLPHTHNLAKNAFTRGVPEHGAELADELERIVALHDASTIAAVIVEPVAGNMGCVPPRDGFLSGLQKLCRRHGALLVFDEVMTGFRVARGGAQERYGVTPDLTTLGKVIGGGLPVGAYGGRRSLMSMIAPDGPVYQAGTLSGNPLAVAAGLATLRVIEANPEIYTHLEGLGRLIDAGMADISSRLGIPLRWNRVGGMGSLFFSEHAVVDWPSAFASSRIRFTTLFHGLLASNIHLPPSPFEAWFWSYAHSTGDVDRLLSVTESVLRAETFPNA